MKNAFKKLVWFVAVSVLRRYQPKIVAITGSAGKTSTKEAIFDVLASKFKVGKTEKNLNTEFGLPLAIFCIKEQPRSYFSWLSVLFKGILVLFFKFDYPEILILEMGADKPGDIKYLTEQIKPDVSVVTVLSRYPAHLEFFASPQEVANEKSNIVKAVNNSGWVVLNFDDELVYKMKELTRAKVISYGLNEGAQVWASDIHYLAGNKGTGFKLNYDDKSVPVRLKNLVGKGAIYSALAAVACGLYFKMNLLEMAQVLEKLKGEKGRLKLIEGIKDSLILDDTYNASPASMVLAIHTLGELKGERKIGVLGDMLELGAYAQEAHHQIGERAGGVCDYLLLFGPHAKFIQEGALHRGLSEENIFYFDNKQALIERLKTLVKKDDLILIKASRGMHFEEIVEAIMQEPGKKEELLVYCFCNYKPGFHRV